MGRGGGVACPPKGQKSKMKPGTETRQLLGRGQGDRASNVSRRRIPPDDHRNNCFNALRVRDCAAYNPPSSPTRNYEFLEFLKFLELGGTVHMQVPMAPPPPEMATLLADSRRFAGFWYSFGKLLNELADSRFLAF